MTTNGNKCEQCSGEGCVVTDVEVCPETGRLIGSVETCPQCGGSPNKEKGDIK